MDAVAQALADPIRRQILLRLRGRSTTAGEIAGCFIVSRPAVSRHLRVLREAGLVLDEAVGRQRNYQLQLDALVELESYLRQLHAAASWGQHFDALATEVHRVKTRRRAQKHRPHSTRKQTA